MVFSTWVRGLSKLKCIIVYPTPSHSFWKWSWLCSWWGSVRVEVILKFLKKKSSFFSSIKPDGVFESLLVSLSFPPFSSSSSCTILQGETSSYLSRRLDTAPPHLMPMTNFSCKGVKVKEKRRRPLSAPPGCKISNTFSPSKVLSSTP